MSTSVILKNMECVSWEKSQIKGKDVYNYWMRTQDMNMDVYIECFLENVDPLKYTTMILRPSENKGNDLYEVMELIKDREKRSIRIRKIVSKPSEVFPEITFNGELDDSIIELLCKNKVEVVLQ